eukprot:TRINITY_DN24686_c0_g1_i1.p1 TRINITY_DN24686_c0_g1~~TRINITY_DN24686_c0_g1_i1.p1  ORF type:complete len:736 (+),score=185.54 TRINITY_DN24686_c0_g1_i1:1-2208(+)
MRQMGSGRDEASLKELGIERALRDAEKAARAAQEYTATMVMKRQAEQLKDCEEELERTRIKGLEVGRKVGEVVANNKVLREELAKLGWGSEDGTATATPPPTQKPGKERIPVSNDAMAVVKMKHANGTLRSEGDIPRGLRLVMVGDSLMRYQYISLAYFLATGTWWDPSRKVRQITAERSKFNDWEDFFTTVTALLHPHEYCDCYRSAEIEDTTENRYFYDAKHDNFVAFHQAFGHNSSMHGSVAPGDVWKMLFDHAGAAEPPKFHYDLRERTWTANTWDGFIRDVASRYDPKPTHAIFNAGWWRNDFQGPGGDKAADDLLAALAGAGIKGIWKTVTRARGGAVPLFNIDAAMEKKFDTVLDVAWTGQLDAKWYWDEVHFWEPVYRISNEDLLIDVLGYELPQYYQRAIRSHYYDGYVPDGADTPLRRDYSSSENQVLDVAARPAGLRVVMVGDLGTFRSQYFSLIHFLAHGRWFDPAERTQCLVTPHDWAEEPGHPIPYFKRLRKAFGLHEHIDSWWTPSDADANDNRYFRTGPDAGDNYVAFHSKYGSLTTFRGRVPAGKVSALMGEVQQEAYYTAENLLGDYEAGESGWEHKEWHEFVEKHVLNVEPRPTHFVMSVIAMHDFTDKPEVLEKLIEVLHGAGVKLVWRTSTFHSNHHIVIYNIDDMMCKRADLCVDVGWTSNVGPEFYASLEMLHEPAYRAMNEDLLEALGYRFPVGYRKVVLEEELFEQKHPR